MWGANSEELLRVAARLEDQATRIDATQRALTSRLRAAPWHGAAADRYRGRWEGSDRQQLIAAAGFLRAAADDMRRNAGEQAEAAGAGGGGSSSPKLAMPVSGILAGIGTAWGTIRQTAETWGYLAAPILGLGKLTAAAATIGRYTNAYRPLANAGDFFRYKQSPVLQAIKSWGGAAGKQGGWVKHITDNPAFKWANTGAGKIGTIGSRLDVATDLRDIVTGHADGRRMDNGDYARKAADALGSSLKASKNPVSYLVGVNVSIWSDVVETGKSAIDSGDMTLKGIPSPFSKENFTGVYVQSAKDVGQELVGMMKGWF